MSKPGQNYEAAKLYQEESSGYQLMQLAYLGAGEAELAAVLPHLSTAPPLTKGYFRTEKQPQMIPYPPRGHIALSSFLEMSLPEAARDW